MFISNGWSGEYASGVWGKVNIGVGEEDLRRILISYSERTGHAVPDPADLNTTTVFKLLTWETDRLLAASLVSRMADPGPQQEAIKKAVGEQEHLLNLLAVKAIEKEGKS